MAAPLFREFLRRRIPQVVGVYLAAGWGLLEFTDWATERLGLNPNVTLVMAGVGLALLPIVIWVAWWFGGGETASGAGGEGGDSQRDQAHSKRPGEGPVDPPGLRSVGVLPFANLGNDASDEYLSDGISEEILNSLSRVQGLRVASRTSGFALKGSQLDVREIGRRMGVGAVLEGSVRREGDRIRVSTRLVNAQDGYQLWSDRFDRSMDDLFAIEEEIAGKVAEALEGILRRPPPRSRTRDPRAYEYFLRGKHYLRQWKKKGLLYARDMFRRAVEQDPRFARAWAGISDSIFLLCTYYPSAQAELQEAVDASRRALALAPDLAESHSAQGSVLFLQGQAEEAAAAFERAIQLDPTLFEAHYFYARANFQMGKLERAEELFRRASEVDPEDYQSVFFRAQSIEAQGRHEEALDAYREALNRAEAFMDLFPDDARAATMRAVSLCRLGRAEEGLEWGERALEIDPDDAGVRYNVACLYALEGMADRALDCLEDAMEVGFGNREWLERDPDIESLRDHPRFREIMDRVGDGGGEPA